MFQKLLTSLSPSSSATKKKQRAYLDDSINSATRVTVVKKGSPRRREFDDVDPGTGNHEMTFSIKQLQRQENSRLTNSNRSGTSLMSRPSRRRLKSPSDLSWGDDDDDEEDLTLSGRTAEFRDDQLTTTAEDS
mmetsp:Transcript_16648/g.36402  ORF Transcript_16648/g.36402 Transcript_16648/m.36402 type:complete len:133 (+) Transcript_16648:193-591(+)|eukprot:CAMPEP_0168748694 /NCGR_PEP_ID=MMETSP0724-20121128/16309_1 /TAXON_ID=265536 /ORGANISM="Amphiprora sp., Strain CCMP467" /LENGTH=132 /DNA_ID=CAMNT_0008796533 /DNA_START=196 /DNA_END=594 /DNA_ORIENTATION=-